MAVSKSEWAEMSWKQRIAAALDILQITKKELAERLNVSTRTIDYWQAFKKTPSDKYAKLLKSWCTKDTFDDIRDESYMALHSLSADASLRLIENACISKDIMMLAMASHCVAIKLAAIITKNSKLPQHTIIYINSLYGDSKTTVRVQNARIDPTTYTEIIIHPPLDYSNLFTLIVTQFSNANAVEKFAFSVSDKALLLIANRTNTHLSLH